MPELSFVVFITILEFILNIIFKYSYFCKYSDYIKGYIFIVKILTYLLLGQSAILGRERRIQKSRKKLSLKMLDRVLNAPLLILLKKLAHLLKIPRLVIVTEWNLSNFVYPICSSSLLNFNCRYDVFFNLKSALFVFVVYKKFIENFVI